MFVNLSEFIIHDLWGEKNICLRFKDNRLIYVGENGSGKTTILRIVYETLACKWTLLSGEDFSEIEVIFEDGYNISISKENIAVAHKLVIHRDSDVISDLPMVIKRAVFEYANLSDRSISCDHLMEVLNEYGYNDSEIYRQIHEKIESVEGAVLSKYADQLKSKIGYKIIYLPTYRRSERHIGYLNERGYNRHQISVYRHSDQAFIQEPAIEIVKTSMNDVERFIRQELEDIREKSDVSAAKLNYQCFKGILNKTSDKIPFSKNILSPEEIEKVFGSINENILSSNESKQIKRELEKIQGMDSSDNTAYDKIVYYFYSMLHDRFIQLRKNENVILSFFKACNSYLVNKRFKYCESDFSYKIIIDNNGNEREIDLDHLSSGEKQIVSVFSYMYLAKLEKAIVIIDEPELSLSVEWQEKFLLDISKGDHCAGVISATHSPFIFNNELRKYAHSLEEFIL